jgi:hypothetical protein
MVVWFEEAGEHSWVWRKKMGLNWDSVVKLAVWSLKWKVSHDRVWGWKEVPFDLCSCSSLSVVSAIVPL